MLSITPSGESDYYELVFKKSSEYVVPNADFAIRLAPDVLPDKHGNTPHKSNPWHKLVDERQSKTDNKPNFFVRMTGSFEFEIVLNESLPSLAKQYAVMDMKGQVLSVGELNGKDTRVKVPTSGAYVVRVGLGYKRVNVK